MGLRSEKTEVAFLKKHKTHWEVVDNYEAATHVGRVTVTSVIGLKKTTLDETTIQTKQQFCGV